MDVLKQLKEYYWGERRLLYVSILFLAISTALGLVYPLLLRYLIDDVIKVKQFEIVPYLSLFLVLVIVIKASFQYLHGYTGGRVGNKVAYNLRNASYQKLQYLSFQYYDRAKTGDLMSRLTADLEAIRHFMAFGFAQILNLVFMVTFGAVAMALIDWRLTLISLATMPFMAFTALRFEKQVHPAFRSIRKSMANLTSAVQENITGVRTIKSFAREPHEIEKFSLRSEDYRVNHVDTANIWAKFFPGMELISNLSLVMLLAAGGYYVINGSMGTGDLVAFFTLIYYIIGPMWGLGFHINVYTQFKASGERVNEIINHYVHVKELDGALSLETDQIRGDIRFENVSFSYTDKEPALMDINFDAPAGKVIGFLGATGSGKSTIIQLLMRAYNLKEGAITLDDNNIKNLRIEDLRRHISIVFQETFMFSASIRNNLAYGIKDVTDDEIIRAAKLAQAHEFIMELPLGYETVVGERGLGLSGGQKQRIAIARALIKDPKILVLDDATSAVDMETEHEIQTGFKQVMKGRTTFIIAHRISSLRQADEIIVLDKGKIVQRGTHKELLKEAGPYLQTYNIQYADRPKKAIGKGERGLTQ
jgi:ATP-binding cassette subfamily B multidrug efflux pump